MTSQSAIIAIRAASTRIQAAEQGLPISTAVLLDAQEPTHRAIQELAEGHASPENVAIYSELGRRGRRAHALVARELEALAAQILHLEALELAGIPVEIPTEIREAVEACARGSYQQALLAGRESWSGSSLRGKASSYGASYGASRAKLLAAIQGAMRPMGWDARTAICEPAEGGRAQRQLQLRPAGGDWITW